MMADINYNEMDEVELLLDPKADSRSEGTLRQSLAFDMVPDTMLLEDTERLGLHPCSQEVWDAEQQASQQRRNNIGPVLPLLSILSRLSSEVLNAAILVRQDEDDEVDDTLNTSQILSASVGIIATLVDLGVVHLAHTPIKMDYSE